MSHFDMHYVGLMKMLTGLVGCSWVGWMLLGRLDAPGSVGCAWVGALKHLVEHLFLSLTLDSSYAATQATMELRHSNIYSNNIIVIHYSKVTITTM